MGFIRQLTGKDAARSSERAGEVAADASVRAAEIQAESGRAAIEEGVAAAGRAQQFFTPFAGAGERGVEASQFLANPQAQFDFLQGNPLFNLALENANQQTAQQASAGRRLSFGDTLQQLSNNVLLSASPLIDRQREDITNLLNLGTNVATSQANIETGQAATAQNLITDIGAAQAGGIVGGANARAGGAIAGANARAAGAQNLLTTGLTAAAVFSDERLKTNKKLIGRKHGHNWWSWDWNEPAGKLFGLFGSSEGVMAQEVAATKPNAIQLEGLFYKVNYGAI